MIFVNYDVTGINDWGNENYLSLPFSTNFRMGFGKGYGGQKICSHGNGLSEKCPFSNISLVKYLRQNGFDKYHPSADTEVTLRSILYSYFFYH
ncbi:unnamed protein product [Rhizophagus irregularis]|nr:unnamed protein product [Rhizophagus irregularis]